MGRKKLIGANAEPALRPLPKKRAGKSKIANRQSAINVAAVELVPLSKINPAPYNPRRELKPGDPEFAKLKRSIERFGMVDHPVWNRRSGYLVGGHQRLAVLRHLQPDLSAVHVSVVDLDDAAEKQLNIALNKIAGGWDETKLAELLREIEQEADATDTGFDQAEIDALLAEVSGGGGGELDTSPQLGEAEYRIVVDCRGELHQRELLKRFKKEDLKCRALIS